MKSKMQETRRQSFFHNAIIPLTFQNLSLYYGVSEYVYFR